MKLSDSAGIFGSSKIYIGAYGFLQGAWPFGVVEAIWALVALRRWAQAGRSAI